MWKAAFAAALLIIGASNSEAQTFSFGPEELRSRFNAALAEDEMDTIRNCKRFGADLECSFTDQRYQAGVKAMKELNLANGRFEIKRTVLITTKGKTVETIIVSGDRSDPINLFHFIATVVALIRAISPTTSDDDVLKTVSSLGLMRGDSDPTIGRPIDQVESYAAIKCNNQGSKVSTAIGCVFNPRF